MDWQPIETAPKDDTPVLLTYMQTNKQRGYCVSRWQDGAHAYPHWRGYDGFDFTHWAAITPPSTVGEKLSEDK